MDKKRDTKTGQFQQTDYSSYIGNQYGCCKLIKVYSTAIRKIAVLKCVYCGKEKNVNASSVFNYPKKYCSCDCQGKQKEFIYKHNQSLMKEEKLQSNNTSGYTGIFHITKCHGRPVNLYRATITHNKHTYFLGEFKDKMKAVEARRNFIKEKGWIDDNDF